MMCAERLQRIFLAIILGINMGLVVSQPQIAFFVQLVLIILLLIGGFSGKCISLKILSKFIPSCDPDRKES